MSNHIGRLGGIGIQKETTPGVEAGGSIIWLPKVSGKFQEDNVKAPLDAGYSSIHDIAEHSTEEAKGMLSGSVVLGNITYGHLLLAALGQESLCVVITIAGASGGTPARGDSISSATGSWTGTIKKIFTVGGTTHYAVTEDSGTIDAQTDVTNGTWTGGTSAVISGVNAHYFSVLNNNNHPSYTLYEHTPVSDKNGLYGMLNSIDFNFVRNDYLKAAIEFMSKKVNSDTSLSPNYDGENYFRSRHFGVRVAADETSLNAADLVSAIESMSLTVAKNIEVIPGSRDAESNKTDPESLANTAFGASGQIVLPYASDTYRDYFTSDTVRACRQEWIDYDSSALSGSIYPSLYIDWYKVQFSGFDKSDDNNAVVKQTLDIVPEYDRNSGVRVDALLLNSQATAY